MNPAPLPVVRIVSGGQTGVDRAALDAAAAAGLERGGWVPLGRRAEDGPIAAAYPMRETDSPEYAVRTRRNVADSDATLILTRGPLSGGTRLTVEIARALARPHRVVDVERPVGVAETRDWLIAEAVRVLNIAGPRESTAPGIHARALRFLGDLLGRNPSK